MFSFSDLFNYCDRKKPGRLDVFVDLNKKRILYVPKNKEHWEFACELYGSTENLQKLIPCTLYFEKEYPLFPIVSKIYFGNSSLERRLDITHNPEHLENAQAIIFEELQRSPFQLQCKEVKVFFKKP